jgi:hypothetical protein
MRPRAAPKRAIGPSFQEAQDFGGVQDFQALKASQDVKTSQGFLRRTTGAGVGVLTGFDVPELLPSSSCCELEG